MTKHVNDWAEFHPYFTRAEFACNHTGECLMDIEFMWKLLRLRKRFNAPMIVNSGYRHPTHPVEARKRDPKGGAHPSGRAADFRLSHTEADRLLALVYEMGELTGKGIQQKGGVSGRFIHLDDLPNQPGQPRPHIWSY